MRTVLILFLIVGTNCCIGQAQQITVAGQPGQLDIRAIGEHSIRVTLKPVSYKENFPYTPAVAANKYGAPVISLRSIDKSVKKAAGNLNIEVRSNPLSIVITNKLQQPVQHLIFSEDGKLSFVMTDHPVLGLGEGGALPASGANWRQLPVQYDRRGQYDKMQPRWQSDAYGSRNPVALLIGTEGWALFVATPWVEVDLREKDRGIFIPWQPVPGSDTPQTHANQRLNLGKGVHPVNKIVPGLYDLFVTDAHNPAWFMKDFSVISGPSAMPPKWALGYMQSHRTLEDDKQMMGIVDSFRIKKIPVDAVIYLGTGFTPRGWNTMQPSFDFNPEVFTRNPKDVISDMHNRHMKVIVHMVPWDRDKLPTLQGSIPAKPGEVVDASHLKNYWQQHMKLVNDGIDAFWPDEGDWFNLFERINRHQLYYQGHLSAYPNIRPWSLHRNGFPGIAQWGGWVWSGDTESSWKTLEAQIAVGINYSLSIGPYWGSDIGGFYPNQEYTGELYARWFQFGAFNGSFRSHGRTWWTHLPWGWGLNKLGPLEGNRYPLESELNNKTIEPVIKKYAELHYQLLPYTYTLSWEARNTGMPLMRAMWLHYPADAVATGIGDQYLWGRDMLVAPVFEKGATSRKVYLPKGEWYDWWTDEKITGGQTITRNVNLETMPLYVKTGAIIPVDPVRQYADQPVNEPTTLKVYRGTDGHYTLYEDDGISQEYLAKKGTWTSITWNEKQQQVTLAPGAPTGFINVTRSKTFNIQLIPGNEKKTIVYSGKPVTITFVTEPVSIRVNLDKEIAKMEPIWAWFGYDEPNYTYMKDGKKLLSELAQLSPVPVYVRAHNMLTSGDGIAAFKWGSTNAYTEDANGNPVYNWKIVDSIFDTYIKRGMKPLAEFGFMPEALSTNPQPYRHTWQPGQPYSNINTGWRFPPKDYKKWGELVYQWVKHSVDRYGKKEVESWYWELWNEPDAAYWGGTVEEFCKLYDYTVEGAKRALPTARVGGPHVTGGMGRAATFLKTFLEHCISGTNYVTGKTGTSIDFIGFHAKGAPVLVNGMVRMNAGRQLKNIEGAFSIIASYPQTKNLPVVIGESDPEGCAACGMTTNPSNAYRNGTMYSSYTAATFARKYALADKTGVNFVGAVSWSFEFENQPWFHGFRDLATNGVDKPVLNVFRMFGKMSGKRVEAAGNRMYLLDSAVNASMRGPQTDIGALASKDKKTAAVMIWNYHDDDKQGLAENINVTVNGIPAGKVTVTHYRIDDKHSNSYEVWKKMGSPQNPTAEQVTQLEKAGQLETLEKPAQQTVKNGALVVNIQLPRQGVSLLKLDW